VADGVSVIEDARYLVGIARREALTEEDASLLIEAIVGGPDEVTRIAAAFRARAANDEAGFEATVRSYANFVAPPVGVIDVSGR